MPTLIKIPDSQTATSLFASATQAIRHAPKRAANIQIAARRMLDALLALWASNQYFRDAYDRTKQENANLHRLLAATVDRLGELRFSKAELDAIDNTRRIQGFCVRGSTDVVLKLSDQALLVHEAPGWLADAAEGKPVPQLTRYGEKVFLPTFDITDLDASVVRLPGAGQE